MSNDLIFADEGWVGACVPLCPAAPPVPRPAGPRLYCHEPRLPGVTLGSGHARHSHATATSLRRVVLHESQYQVRALRQVPRRADTRLHGAVPEAGGARRPLRYEA